MGNQESAKAAIVPPTSDGKLSSSHIARTLSLLRCLYPCPATRINRAPPAMSGRPGGPLTHGRQTAPVILCAAYPLGRKLPLLPLCAPLRNYLPSGILYLGIKLPPSMLLLLSWPPQCSVSKVHRSPGTPRTARFNPLESFLSFRPYFLQSQTSPHQSRDVSVQHPQPHSDDPACTQLQCRGLNVV